MSAQSDAALARLSHLRFPGVAPLRHHVAPGFLIAVGQGLETPQSHHEMQPSHWAEGRFVLAFDGWLGNRDDVARSLDLPDIPTRPDSDVVAAALSRWGEDALSRLHGDFALAWWDCRDRRLLVACDRTGGRTLFFHTDGPGLVFASVLPALFAHPAVPRVLDAEQVGLLSFSLDPPRGPTCFRGIRQLMPGHCLLWDGDGGRERRYWRPDPARRIRYRRDDDYVAAGREILDRVVGEAARVDGPLVCLLSGGLDSSAVAATAARLTAPAPVHAITFRPDPTAALPSPSVFGFEDEWGHAQAVAALYPSMVHHAAAAVSDNPEDRLRDWFRLTGRPPFHLLAPSWGGPGMDKVAALGARTVLIGLAGNATLSASILPVALQGRLGDLPAVLWGAALTASLSQPVLPYLRSVAPEGPRELWQRAMGRWPWWRRQQALRQEAVDRLQVRRRWRDFVQGDPAASWGQRGRLRLLERTWWARSCLSPLRFGDGFSQRDPLADVRLAEYCLAIPSSQFTRWGRDRHLARRVLADRLPPQVAEERRRGIQSAHWHDWMTRLRPWLESEVDAIADNPLAADLLDVGRLRAILARWPADADSAQRHQSDIMIVLGRGVAIGNFIRWAEGRNR